MDGLVALLRSCTECLKSILTTQQFGSEYELLCSELSVQWLRIRLWGESVGLHIEDAQRLQNSLFSRPEVESTITQSVHCIAYILKEIEVIRRKYELRPRLALITDPLSKTSSIPEPVATEILHQRMRDNQKQKSFLAITKWALCDSRRFDEKVRKLKSMIDGLEDISQAAGITCAAVTRPRSGPVEASSEGEEEESPPPYSFDPPSGRRPSRASIPEPVVTETAPVRTSFQGSVLLEHYTVLKTFLGPDTFDAGHPGSRAQEKLSRLTYNQFKELRTDVYDELIRRQDIAPLSPFLPPNTIYHDKRNQARKKLSTLPTLRFTDLTMDVVFELDRRYPHLKDEVIQNIDPFSTPRSPTTRRYGCVLPPNTPPPPLCDRPIYRFPRLEAKTPLTSHPSTPLPPSNPFTTPETPSTPSSTFSPNSPRTVEIFKTFRVSLDDPTWKVLPVALKKYGVNAPAENYDLWIMYGGNIEKRLDREDKPLAIFKQLDKEGQKPMFMMRKKARTVFARE